MRDHPISQRRACVLVGVDPKTVRREHPPDNPEIRAEMNKIAEKRRRFARELDALIRIYGKPACIVSDNGAGSHESWML